MASCPSCGSPLVGDETFCLQCGARIVPAPPDRPRWAVAAGIVIAIAVVGGAAVFFALEQVESDAERAADRPAEVIEERELLPPDDTPSRVASWPAESSAFTVVLASAPTEAAARERAEAAIGSGIPVGVLDAADYPSLESGRWLVFTGRFDARADAARAAERHAAGRFPRARAAFVSASGG